MSEALFKPQRIEVSSEGVLVVLKFGNVEIKLDHETAIKLSTWLRVRGKEAKRRAGDTSRHWTVIGVLDDLNAGRKDPW